MDVVFWTGYLQFGSGKGPFKTESVAVAKQESIVVTENTKNEYKGRWLAFYEGKWRRVHVQSNRTFIKYREEKITIQIGTLG